MYVTGLRLASWTSLGVTQNAYFPFLTHTKQLLLVAFWDTIVEIVFRCTLGHTDGQLKDRQTWKLN